MGSLFLIYAWHIIILLSACQRSVEEMQMLVNFFWNQNNDYA